MPDKGKYLTVWKKQADGSWKDLSRHQQLRRAAPKELKP
jgi:ketosteroid isomerase-like protein